MKPYRKDRNTANSRVAEVESKSPSLLSSQAQLAYEQPAFNLAWQNQVMLHVAKHLIRLRRYQKKSQSELADAMQTSQLMIARLESGDGNITLDTLQRAVVALNGRFDISISPAELNLPPRLPWWETRRPRALQPAAALLCKLGSIAVHAEEFLSPSGHEADKLAFDQLMRDPEVREWIDTMDKLGFVPKKR